MQTLHVHLPNHGFRTIRFDEASDVRQVINLIVGSMSPGQSPNPQSYAIRLRHILTREVCIDQHIGKVHIDAVSAYDFNSFFIKIFSDFMDATRYVIDGSHGPHIKSLMLEFGIRMSQCNATATHKPCTSKVGRES